MSERSQLVIHRWRGTPAKPQRMRKVSPAAWIELETPDGGRWAIQGVDRDKIAVQTRRSGDSVLYLHDQRTIILGPVGDKDGHGRPD